MKRIFMLPIALWLLGVSNASAETPQQMRARIVAELIAQHQDVLALEKRVRRSVLR